MHILQQQHWEDLQEDQQHNQEDLQDAQHHQEDLQEEQHHQKDLQEDQQQHQEELQEDQQQHQGELQEDQQQHQKNLQEDQQHQEDHQTSMKTSNISSNSIVHSENRHYKVLCLWISEIQSSNIVKRALNLCPEIYSSIFYLLASFVAKLR